MRLEYRHLQWMEFIWDADLTTKAKVVAAYLSRCMNKDHHVAWPSLERLAAVTGLSRRTVVYALDELEEQGWITREKGGPGLGSSRYHAVFPRAVEALLAGAGDALGSAGDALGSATIALDVVQEVHPNQSNRISQEKRGNRKRFAPPSADEVRDYAKTIGYLIRPDLFLAHYEANGWMQGRGKPIKDWRAAVRTWKHRELDGRDGLKADQVKRGRDDLGVIL